MGKLIHNGITYANVNMGMLDKMPYVYSTGKQSVALPLYSDDYPIIKTKIITNTRREQALYIGDIASWSQSLFGFYNENDGNLYFRGTPYVCPVVSQKFFNFVDIEIDYTTGVFVYDGVSYGNVSKTQEHAQVALFGRPSDRQGFMAIADVEIYKSGSLYMHLVPRKDESTGKGYLYDVVNDVSYQSDTATPLEYDEMPVVNEIMPTPEITYLVRTTSTGGNDAAISITQYTDGVQSDYVNIVFGSATNHYRFHDFDVFYGSGKWTLTSWANYIEYNSTNYGTGEQISQWAYNTSVYMMMVKTTES